jgi:hypothetical protein
MVGAFAQVRKSNSKQGWGNLTESGRYDSNYDFSIVDRARSLSTEFPNMVKVVGSFDRIKRLRYTSSGLLNSADQLNKDLAQQVMKKGGNCRGWLFCNVANNLTPMLDPLL